MYTINGKPDQKNLPLNEHVALVKKIAYLLKAKLPASVEVDDLVQVGMMGLLDALNRYEDTHGAQFETYAAQRIRGAMLDELRSSDWMPRGARQNMRKIEVAINVLEQQLGRPPAEAELARQLQMTLEEYQAMLNDGCGHQLLYYEDFAEGDGGNHFLDQHQQDEDSDPLKELMSSGFREALVEAIEALPEREKLLMGLYYEQELNLKEIGSVMNVSESRVCQIHSQAVSRLRAKMKEQLWTGVA
ncbi:MAG: RNA polymerase sigma factor FliA [Methylophilaceae bacterium]